MTTFEYNFRNSNLSKAIVCIYLHTYVCIYVSSDPEVSGCEELMSFLEVPNHDIISTTTALTQYFYKNGKVTCTSCFQF